MIIVTTLCDRTQLNPYFRIFLKYLVWGLIVNSGSYAYGRDFNCPDECGLYSEGDKIGPTLQSLCEAFKENPECKENFVETPKKEKKKKKKKKKRNKKSDDRIVGGVSTKHPMPWMVLIYIDDAQCGGTLINSQFVLTAAHCFCTGYNRCSRQIGEMEEGESIKIKESFNLAQVKIFIGVTDEKRIGLSAEKIWESQDEEITFEPEKIFIHPLLGTDKKFIMSPDIALIKLKKRVKIFNSSVRPICLGSPGILERPLCPDMSQDREANKTEISSGLVHDRAAKKMLGGCGTVAGWGNRYNQDEMMEKESRCETDFSDKSPDKLEHCLSHWTLDGEEMSNCTKKDIHVDDLTKPCALFVKELLFQKKLHTVLGTNATKTKYNMMDINDLVNKQRAPMELVLRTKKKKKLIFHCGKTEFSRGERRRFNGWCATKLDRKFKIQRWGFCNSACTDDRDTFLFANVNLLTDKECEELLKNGAAGEDKKGDYLKWNREYEICVGKKHVFPKHMISFIRRKKRKHMKEDEKAKVKEVGLASGYKPTKFRYIVAKNLTRVSLGTPNHYGYDWFLGAVDTCQGDSGGPLWRNLKDGDKIRATQIGVVSRGRGCAKLNSPAIFGSVRMIFTWIKETVEKEMDEKDFCPQKKKNEKDK